MKYALLLVPARSMVSGAPFGSSAVAITRALAVEALPNSRYSHGFAVKALPAG
jgi:hypothetical protein